jgi:hypothetical protein
MVRDPEAMVTGQSVPHGENFLFNTRNNVVFLFDTEIEIIFYMSSTQVFLSYLTFPSVL